MDEWRLEYYARRYANGAISMARAAQECGFRLWEIMEYLRSKRIPYQYDFDAWEEDVAAVERLFADRTASSEGRETGSPG